MSSDTEQALFRQMYFMTVGVDALEALSKCMPDAIEQEQVTPEEVGYLMKCVAFSLLTTQRKIIRAIESAD